MHVRIAAGHAGRGDDLEPAASRRGHLHLRIYARWGGQMTPFDCASLSPRGSVFFPSPTVGDSPFMSGGHVTLCWGTACLWSADWADAEPVTAKPVKSAIRTADRMSVLPRHEDLRLNVHSQETFQPPNA